MWRGLVATLLATVGALAQADLHAILVGCSYEGSKSVPHLDCPPNDVTLFSQLIKAKPANVIELVTGGELTPTKAAILDAFQRTELACRPDDTFVFFFSGHGEPTRSGKTCIVPDGPMPASFDPDHDFIDIASLRSELENHCEAKHALIVLDSCYSGGKGLQQSARGDGAHPGPDIIVLAATGANQQAYETSDKYSVFTLALSQLVNEDATTLTAESRTDVDSFQTRLRTRVRDLCRSSHQMPQDPVIFAPPRETMEVFTPSLSSETVSLIKKPLVSIDILKMLKRGIGVALTCKEAPIVASRVESLVRQRLLENGYPVFGTDRSLELATVINKASTLEGQKIAADLTDRLLITGSVTYTGGNQTLDSLQWKTAGLTLNLQVMDLQGKPVIEFSTDSADGPAKGFGPTEDDAIAMAVKSLVASAYETIKPQLEVIVTKRMPPVQDQ